MTTLSDTRDLKALSPADRRIIRRHIDFLRRSNDSECTMTNRRDNLRRLAKQLPCDLLDATDEDLEAWQSEQDVAASSLATYTSHVHAFYAWALDNELIAVDPSLHLAQPKVPKAQPRPIPLPDLMIILRCVTGLVRIWIILSVYMGLRSGEIARIRREDVTQDEVNDELRFFISGIGKGAKPFKLIVPTHVEPELLPYLTMQPGSLWRTPRGGRMTSNRVTKECSAFIRSLGMPYTLHCGRHTFGTVAQRHTKDLLKTMAMMRHERADTTLIYVLPDEHLGLEELDKMSAQLLRLNPARPSERPAAPEPPNGEEQASGRAAS